MARFSLRFCHGGAVRALPLRSGVSACEAGHGCHWSYVQGPTRGHLSLKTMVWICEYPFRTVRLGGPCEDCQGRMPSREYFSPESNEKYSRLGIKSDASEDPQVA